MALLFFNTRFCGNEYSDFPENIDISISQIPIAFGSVMAGPGNVGDFVLADFDIPK